MTSSTKANGNERPLHRHGANPLLSAVDWPHPVHTVFNAGATRLRDGTTLLLCRVEDRRGLSHLCAAGSAKGVDGWVVDAEPTLWPDAEHYPEELWGIEDPRITYVEELGRFAVAYTACTRGARHGLGADGGLPHLRALRIDHAARRQGCGPAAAANRQQLALVHRPMTDSGAHIWISFSPDLRNWGSHKLLLPARKGGWWDANKVGPSPPLIEISRGWLMLYHGVRQSFPVDRKLLGRG